MKLCIAGSRNFKLKLEILNTLVEIAAGINPKNVTELVSGKEPSGMDKCGEEWAKQFNIKITPFPYMKEFGRAGGHIRNGYMAEYCDMALVFRNNSSPGSSNMIWQMERVNKPCIVFEFVDKNIKSITKYRVEDESSFIQ